MMEMIEIWMGVVMLARSRVVGVAKMFKAAPPFAVKDQSTLNAVMRTSKKLKDSSVMMETIKITMVAVLVAK
jgi:hypothetical protein